MILSGARVQVCCDTCYRMSPVHDGPVEYAQAYFRGLGWAWRVAERQVCPICSSREETIPPPAQDAVLPAAE